MTETKTIRVLLVEDSPADIQLVKIYLGRIQTVRYEIKLAEKLEEALDILNEEAYQPDIILLDLSLPGSSGSQTFGAIKLKRPRSAILILTNMMDERLALELTEKGAAGYLLKSSANQQGLHLNVLLAIERHRNRLLRNEQIENLQRIEQVQMAQLDGLPTQLVACAVCHQVRDDSIIVSDQSTGAEQWLSLKDYLEKHGIFLSHTFCPVCMPAQVDKVIKDTSDV